MCLHRISRSYRTISAFLHLSSHAPMDRYKMLGADMRHLMPRLVAYILLVMLHLLIGAHTTSAASWCGCTRRPVSAFMLLVDYLRQAALQTGCKPDSRGLRVFSTLHAYPAHVIERQRIQHSQSHIS